MIIKKEDIQSTYKSQDTEEWLDMYFTRPIGYLWARFFNHFDVHPNVVTIFSIFLGVAAGVMFYYKDIWHNVAGVLLLMWANFYDSCDGQLARMTGKKTHWGRMLDGFAGDLWFLVIYFSISFRLMNEFIPFTHVEWSIWIFVLCTFSGIVCHARQCQLADYYRNIHLYFMKGVSNELDNSSQQQQILDMTPKKGNFWWRIFLKNYVRYARAQEKLTPNFQLLMNEIKTSRNGRVSKEFCDDFRSKSRPLMKYANILTFNCRAITLYVACLIDEPWLYPTIEIIVFSSLSLFMQYRHENMCKHFLQQLKAGAY